MSQRCRVLQGVRCADAKAAVYTRYFNIRRCACVYCMYIWYNCNKRESRLNVLRGRRTFTRDRDVYIFILYYIIISHVYIMQSRAVRACTRDGGDGGLVAEEATAQN